MTTALSSDPPNAIVVGTFSRGANFFAAIVLEDEAAVVNITRILCPIDFSATSRHAIEQAVVIAGWYRASITALHVYSYAAMPTPGLALSGPLPGTLPGPEQMEALRSALTDAARPALDHGIPTDICLENGWPATEILACADRVAADLITIGTHGTEGFEHLILGSVTEKVVRKAKCPVLTVPPRAVATSALPFKRILCAVDFSPSSDAALRYALSLAQEGEAALTLMHVLEWPWEEPPAPTLSERSSVYDFDLARYRRDREMWASAQLERLVPDDVRNWCTPSITLSHGKPHVEILRQAGQEQTDLLVVGVRGRASLDLHLFGSTTNQLIRRATCPVLTVHR